MSKISTYEVAPLPKLADKLIGTSVGGEIEDVTYNFTLQELLDVFLPVIPANNLQGVLDYGNTATQDINLIGTITTTNLEVTDTANFLNSYFVGDTHIQGGLFDSGDSIGLAGQVLTSTGEFVEWVTLPPIFTPNLQQVLEEGNTSTVGIILTAGLEATDVDTNTATINNNITIDGTITDGDASVGAAGTVLSSTVTGVKWVALPVYSATSPLLFNSATGVFSIQQANGSQSGFLSSSDWITFNGKQNAGNYITALTGEVTASGPGSVTATVSNAAVIGKVLTGFNPTAGTINASDSILTAFGKTQSQINALVGGVQYQGVWNASTNTPTLTSSVGVQGHYYVVNVAGNTNLNGITDWQVGDWAIFSESVWQKVDNTDSVTSVNGFTGAVSLTTDNIPEGTTNLYFLNSRARLALSATSPLGYNNTTGVFSIQQASGSQNGYLSSTDWTTFNDKQNYLGGTGLVKSSAGTISYITDNSANWNTAYNDSITSAAVTGTGTKTLTLTQQDAGTITASWTDLGLTSVGVSMPSAFNVANSPLTSNGTIAITGAGNASQYVRGDGTLAVLPTGGGGGGASVSYYLNGSINQGTIGGVTYYEMNKVPVIGTGTDFSTSTNGYIASFLTDVNDPALLQIPAGNWNFETYFNASSGGGSPTFYIELYKYDGVVFTLIASNSASPKLINDGASIEAYFSALAVPQTALTLTDRLAVRIYVTTAGRTITLHTENSHLCQVITTFTTGITAINGLTAQVQNLTTGTSGTDFNINSLVDTHTFNLPVASATNTGKLSSTDWTTFNNKQPAGSYVPTSRTLTINGTTYDLSADRSWSITAGVSSVTATSPLFSSGGSTPDITIQQASGSQNGYLSSTDWTTFNNKQASGNYITSLTGEATGTGPGATAVTLNNASVTAKVLTGINITGGTVQATDTMLTAFGKLQNQINGLIGSTIYQGTWNASTNTPALASGVGVRGYYYIVNVAGTTNLDGITDWFVGDWVIFDGTAWQQVDNTDSVTSVNGFTGAVSLTTDNISEGTTNLYFLNSRARTAISLTTTGTSGAATYNNTTGVFNIPNYTTDLSGYVPTSRTLSINGVTYDLSADRSWTITPNINATTTQDYTATAGQVTFTVSAGYTVGQLAVFYNGSKLASNEFTATDGTTFTLATACQVNDILQAVSSVTGGGIGGTGTINTIPKFTTSGTIGNSAITDDGTTVTLVSRALSGTSATFSGTGSFNQITFTGSTAGRIVFPSAGGVLNGSDNLFWDNTNGYLGVGTNIPSAVVTAFSTSGATQFKAAGTAPAMTFSQSLTSSTYAAVFGLATSNNHFITGTAPGDFAIANQSTVAGAIVFGTGTTEKMRMTSAGTFSIGNTNSTYNLDVTGTGRFTSSVTAGALSRIADVFIGGRSGTYATYTDGIFGDNLHLGATLSGGAVYINTALSRNLIINPVGGNVGIGTSSPAAGYLLDVYGTATFGSSATTGNKVHIGSGAVPSGAAGIGMWATGSNLLSIVGFGDTTIDSRGSYLLINPNGGNVGIGTSSPNSLLQVGGFSGNSILTLGADASSVSSVYFGDGTGAALYRGFVEYAHETDTMRIGTSSAERMIITSGGNVGIGTSTPVNYGTRNFEVNGGSGSAYVVVRGGSNSIIGEIIADGAIYVSSKTAHPLIFRTTDVERMRITSGGDVLLGKSSTSVGVVGSMFAPAGDIFNSVPNNFNSYHLYDTTNSVYRFYVGGNGTINATNTTISAISDIRLKENICDLEIGLDAIMALRPRKFDWKKESGNDGKNIRGFIAQEFEQILPDLIDESINPAPEGEEPYKQIRQDLIPILVKAMQQQQAQIEELKQIVATK